MKNFTTRNIIWKEDEENQEVRMRQSEVWRRNKKDSFMERKSLACQEEQRGRKRIWKREREREFEREKKWPVGITLCGKEQTSWLVFLFFIPSNNFFLFAHHFFYLLLFHSMKNILQNHQLFNQKILQLSLHSTLLSLSLSLVLSLPLSSSLLIQNLIFKSLEMNNLQQKTIIATSYNVKRDKNKKWINILLFSIKIHTERLWAKS